MRWRRAVDDVYVEEEWMRLIGRRRVVEGEEWMTLM